MPATRKSTATKARTKAKPAPVVEPEELEEDEDLEVEDTDDEDLDELEADEVADEKPKTKKSSTSADVTFGIQDLVKEIKKQTGQDTDPRAIRTLIRKMARDGSGRVEREIVPGNRTRYDWSGPNDPEVRAIVEAFKGGELEAEKKAKLDKLKADKAAKAAAKKRAAEEAGEEDETPAKKSTRRAAKKAAPARRTKKAEPVEEIEDDDELDLDDDE